MGPALREAAAKYKGAEAKLIAALRAGKGHPMPVEATDAEFKAVLTYLQNGTKPAGAWQSETAAAAAPAMPIENATCLACHGNEGFAARAGRKRPCTCCTRSSSRACMPSANASNATRHHRIRKKWPHKAAASTATSGCGRAMEPGKWQERERLGVVVEQIDRYLKSVHARPRRDDQSRTNATCYNCHDAHYIYPLGSTGRADGG